ncbi:MAG: flagellar biosynthesis protein FlhF [Treponema sp.]|nr:flagellar biosynthesis protein FlhF [Spirochaetia bacterium]MDD7460765.1 flagellar biosynthesis protein FlhF [Spirochaetales bacterium]MDY5812213.1 flagellar biosynthesis protein FlhF [Treponema sp.]
MYSESIKNDEIQRVTGANRQECLDKIRDMYGTSFLILNTQRKLKPGFLGFFQKDVLEMTYQVINKSSKPSPVNQEKGRFGSFENMSQPAFNSMGNVSVDSNFLEQRDSILKHTGSSVTNTLQIAQITKQMEDMRKVMQEQMDAVIKATTSECEHETICKIRELLEDNGFSKSYRKEICKRMKGEFSIDELNDFDYIQKKVVEWIAESIPIAPVEKKGHPKVIILVGPTGVGKTTTLAKMGAYIALDFKKNKDKYAFAPRMRMITTDTMRVAAVEQLTRWADIINVDVDQAQDSSKLKELFESYASNSDYIFIDTSGYSPNDYHNIANMHTILDVKGMNESVYLTVQAGVSVEDFENIIRNFEAFNFKSVIITKCDETQTFGRVISVLAERKKSVSWITTGQEVMYTIQRADPMWFVSHLKGFNFNQKDVEKLYGNADKDHSGLDI